MNTIKSHTALLIIDAQVNMFDEAMPVYNGKRLLKTLASLIQQARTASVPILFVRNNGGPGEPDEPGTPGWEIYSALQPTADEPIIDKFTSNGFHQTDLHKRLQVQGSQLLIMAGLQTEYCVDATCRGAAELGYDVTIVADGHSTFDMEEMTAVQAIARYNKKFSAFAAVKKAKEIVWN